MISDIRILLCTAANEPVNGVNEAKNEVISKESTINSKAKVRLNNIIITNKVCKGSIEAIHTLLTGVSSPD